MTAQIIDGMPAADYHADPCKTPSLSASTAKVLLAKSARAAWHQNRRLNPLAESDSEAKFDLGTSAHAMLLEGDEGGIVIVYADDWRTAAAKAKRAEAHAAGKTALLEKHFDNVQAMVEVAVEFIEGSEIGDSWGAAKSEQTILWEEEGTWLRSRLDRVTDDRKLIFDFKTTGDASPDAFLRQIPRMGYHIQEAFYRRAVRALGHENPRFIFLAQETEAPFDCALYGCEPGMQQMADEKVEMAIAKWRHCLATNEWSGYGGRVHWASAPAWMLAEHEGSINGGI